jgi:mevalonate kinase
VGVISNDGWGKLLLFGEHAAVYGYPAVGLTLPWKISVSLSLTGESEWTLAGPAAEQGGSEDTELIPRVVKHFETHFPVLRKFGRGIVNIASTIPQGLGFGSSAALCTAVTKAAVAAQYGNKRVPALSTLWAWAHEAERLFHGTPSGIDTGLALYRGLYSFRPRPPQLPGISRLGGFPLYLVVGAVPRAVSAKKLIGAVREQMLTGERATSRRLRDLGDIADQAIGILKGGDPQSAADIGALAVRAHEVLGDMGLSTPDLNALLASGRSAGALGGKLSGAGGGGAFFLLFPDEQSARQGAARLRREATTAGLTTADTIEAMDWFYSFEQAA